LSCPRAHRNLSEIASPFSDFLLLNVDRVPTLFRLFPPVTLSVTFHVYPKPFYPCPLQLTTSPSYRSPLSSPCNSCQPTLSQGQPLTISRFLRLSPFCGTRSGPPRIHSRRHTCVPGSSRPGFTSCVTPFFLTFWVIRSRYYGKSLSYPKHPNFVNSSSFPPP